MKALLKYKSIVWFFISIIIIIYLYNYSNFEFSEINANNIYSIIIFLCSNFFIEVFFVSLYLNQFYSLNNYPKAIRYYLVGNFYSISNIPGSQSYHFLKKYPKILNKLNFLFLEKIYTVFLFSTFLLIILSKAYYILIILFLAAVKFDNKNLLILYFLYFFLSSLILYFLINALGVSSTFENAIIVRYITKVIALIPFTNGGMGIREFFLLYFSNYYFLYDQNINLMIASIYSISYLSIIIIGYFFFIINNK